MFICHCLPVRVKHDSHLQSYKAAVKFNLTHTCSRHFEMADTPTIFTKTSAYSLGGVVAVGLIANVCSKIFLPKNAKWQDKYTFIWLVNFNHSC